MPQNHTDQVLQTTHEPPLIANSGDCPQPARRGWTFTPFPHQNHRTGVAMSPQIRDDRQMRAVTGLSQEKIAQLESVFAQVYHQQQQTAYQTAKAKRKRWPVGGRKGVLATMGEKLMFLLYYLKVYPTFDVLGAQFGMARSKACENLHKLMPILQKTLIELEVLPDRQWTSIEDFRATVSDVDRILIDVTERAYRRETSDAAQREKYSGKKETYRQKYHYLNDR